MKRMDTPSIVLLVGAGRTGKDTIGDYLKRHRGFARTAFAKPLYEALQTLYGVDPVEYLVDDKDAPLPRLNRSVRELLQHLGDHVRAEGGPEILINRLVQRCKQRGEWGQCDIVITDGRTDLEIEWARANGAAVWWVYRKLTTAVRPHHTESIAALHIKHALPGDFRLDNDGTTEQLYERIDAALEAMGIRETAP